MKRLMVLLSLLLVSFGLFSCRDAKPVAVADPQVQTGDLLFVGIPVNYGEDSMAQAIADATSSGDTINFIHTAVLEVDSLGAIWVIDATLAHGVDRHPLDTLFSDFILHRGGTATFEVMRLEDNREARRYVELSRALLGEEYDLYFLAGNGKHYCTELVYDLYVRHDGSHVFDCVPMNFKNAKGEMPAYWTRLFALLGESVPQGQPGTNPQQIHASPQLRHVMYLHP